jgi:hypothetical protein
MGLRVFTILQTLQKPVGASLLAMAMMHFTPESAPLLGL